MTDTSFRLIHDDCFAAMRGLPENSIDSIVTDPPYGLQFLGKKWDRLDWRDSGSLANPNLNRSSMSEIGPEREGANPTCSICGGRARGANTCACEHPAWTVAGKPMDVAGKAEERHERMQNWHRAWGVEALRVLKPGGHLLSFGGTRTFHRLACAIEDAGFEIRDCLMWLYGSGFPKSRDISKAIDKEGGHAEKRGYVAATANLGFGDHRFVGRQLSDTPFSDEAKKWSGWGTQLRPAWEPIIMGRKPFYPETVADNVIKNGTGAINIGAARLSGETEKDKWPTNAILDDDAAAIVADQATTRFFYVPKPDHAERHSGLYATAAGKNIHPTVKPVALMSWLCALITQPGGTVLDPFMGSGSTGIAATRLGFKFIGIEREAEYIEMARHRIEEDAPMFNRIVSPNPNNQMEIS